MILKRTKIHPALCWFMGLAKLFDGAVLVLSLGFLQANLSFDVAVWACRTDKKRTAQ